mmetsp:Transcript_88280/g.193474  ORF Transcript_88280/g.193474 Transcript_88280/m.193474 type:complete len:322 (-) Transcript_88280:210-1175(-)
MSAFLSMYNMSRWRGEPPPCLSSLVVVSRCTARTECFNRKIHPQRPSWASRQCSSTLATRVVRDQGADSRKPPNWLRVLDKTSSSSPDNASRRLDKEELAGSEFVPSTTRMPESWTGSSSRNALGKSCPKIPSEIGGSQRWGSGAGRQSCQALPFAVALSQAVFVVLLRGVLLLLVLLLSLLSPGSSTSQGVALVPRVTMISSPNSSASLRRARRKLTDPFRVGPSGKYSVTEMIASGSSQPGSHRRHAARTLEESALNSKLGLLHEVLRQLLSSLPRQLLPPSPLPPAETPTRIVSLSSTSSRLLRRRPLLQRPPKLDQK